jgi:hypothetical protein
MCFIGQPIYSISDTKIIIISDNNDQITIYSNCINNIYDDNVMILPVPNPETVSFIDITKIDNDLLDNILEDEINNNVTICDYYTKLYYNIDQLIEANNKDFIISNECIKELKTYSGTNICSKNLWGFIVCKLNKGHIKYTPFAYKHKSIINYSYIPTRVYYHIQHYNYYLSYFYSNSYNWNHTIYLVNIKGTILLNIIAENIEDRQIILNNKLLLNQTLNLKNNINIEKYIIKGSQMNIDFFIYNLE